MPSILLVDLFAVRGDLRLMCEQCGRSVVVSSREALLRFGPSAPVREIGRRYRCSVCGSRKIECWPQYHGAPQGQITRPSD